MPVELRVQVLGDEWVGIETPGSNNLPQNYALLPAFPNPFNSTTTINYSVPRASDVSLVMYDFSGRLVGRLISGKVAAGNHTIGWNASDYASGIYVCRLQAGSSIETRKLALMTMLWIILAEKFA